MKVRWDPDQYRRFASHRLRPALELAARLDGLEPKTIWDLGCGTGEITRILAERWPGARVRGVDSSEQMLEKARGVAATGGGGGVTFELGDLASWSTAEPADLLFSNAAYHWIPDHRAVFPRLLEALAPGGALAVQMPMSWDLPSHRAMRDVLELGHSGAPFGSRALREAMGRKPAARDRRVLRPPTRRRRGSRHLGNRVPAGARRRGRCARMGERHRVAAHPRRAAGRGARRVPRALPCAAARALPSQRRRADALSVPPAVPLRPRVELRRHPRSSSPRAPVL